MNQLLELLERDILIVKITILKDEWERWKTINEQMENYNKEMEAIKDNQMEMLEMKAMRPEIMNSFDECNDRLDIVKEWISEFQIRSIEIIKHETYRT